MTNNGNLNYASKTEFISNTDGVVDLSKSIPTCGSYDDPDLMSVFWTMKPQEGSDKRFWPLDVTSSLECKYQVYEKDDENSVIAEENIKKDYMDEGVQRIEVKNGQIRGTLFLPPGKKKLQLTFRKNPAILLQFRDQYIHIR